MATLRTSAAGGATSGTGDRTVAITPAVGDLFVVYCLVSTNTNNSPTCSDNNGGTYTLVDVANVVIATINHRLSVFVRDTLLPNTTATTITVATGSNTSGAVHCLAVSGMTRTGTNGAVRSKGLQNNQAAGTPAPVLNQAALTGNPTIVACGSADTTTTPPASWTEAQDTNFATPTIALETAFRASGFTGTTITFGAAASTTFASHALELDTSVPVSAIAGTAALVFGEGASTLLGAGVLAGAATLTLTASAVVTAAIAGSATLTLGATAHLYHPITQLQPHAVTGRRYGDFYKPPGRIAGSTALAFGASAVPNVTVLMTGTAALTFTGRGLVPRMLTQLQPTMWIGRRYGDFFKPLESLIDGTTALTFGGAGVLIGGVQLNGGADLLFGGSGTVTGTGALAGTGALLFGGSGFPTLPSGVIAGTTSLTFGSVAGLTGTGVLACSAGLLFTGTASGVAIGSLAGTGALLFGGTGNLTLPQGQIAGTATVLFAGSAVATGTGALVGSVTLTLTASLNVTVDLLAGLLAHYRFDGDLTDSSGNGRDLSPGAPAPTFAPGLLGQALDLFSAVRFGSLGIAGPVSSTPFTISLWIKQDDSVTSSDGTGWTSGAGVEFLHSNITGGSTVNWSLNLIGGGVLASGTFPINIWTHFLATYDGVNLIVYVNGLVVSTTTPSMGAANWSSAGNFIVGASTSHDHDEVSIYGRALNAVEVLALWNGGAGLDPTAIVDITINRVVFTGTVVTRRVVTGSVCTRRVFEES